MDQGGHACRARSGEIAGPDAHALFVGKRWNMRLSTDSARRIYRGLGESVGFKGSIPIVPGILTRPNSWLGSPAPSSISVTAWDTSVTTSSRTMCTSRTIRRARSPRWPACPRNGTVMAETLNEVLAERLSYLDWVVQDGSPAALLELADYIDKEATVLALCDGGETGPRGETRIWHGPPPGSAVGRRQTGPATR
jgi:hypothetical protein